MLRKCVEKKLLQNNDKSTREVSLRLERFFIVNDNKF